MKIGSLNHRIILIEPQKIPDGMGGYEKNGENRYEVWADVRTFSNSGANNKGSMNTVVSDTSRKVYIRKLAGNGIKRGWKAEINQKIYEVDLVDDILSDHIVFIVSRKEVGV